MGQTPYWAQTQPDDVVMALAALLPESARVVDLGAGTGRNSLPLADERYEVFAVERDAEVVRKGELLQRTFDRIGVRHRFVHDDMTSPTLLAGEAPFDAVVCTLALQELSSDGARTMLGTMRRMTVPGGYNVVVAYIGNEAEEHKVNATLFRRGEVRRAYEAARWQIVFCVETKVPIYDLRDGSIAPRSHCVLLARRPVRQQPAMCRDAIDALATIDPEQWEFLRDAQPRT